MLISSAPRIVDLGAALRARLGGFAGFLRANGYGVGGAESVRVLEATARTGVLDQQVLRWSLKALLCGRGDEWRRFDALFDAYFLPPNKKIFVESNIVAAAARESAAGAGDNDEAEPAAGAEYRCWLEIDGTRRRVGRMWFAGGVAYWVGPSEDLAAIQPGSRFGVTLVTADGTPAGDVLAGDL